jgi:hypothetical protein
LVPGKENQTYIENVYDAARAMEIVQASIEDYEQMFG